MHVDDRIVRIEDKIDSIKDGQERQNAILAAQHESLKDHMRRTELLEEAIKPLVKHDNHTMAYIKLAVFVTSIGAGAEGFLALIKFLKH